MLLLGEKIWKIQGVSVFPDDVNSDQFWYLPSSIELVRQNGRAKFTLIKYKPAAAGAGAKGGGFLTFDVALKIKPEAERKIMAALRRESGKPRLSPAVFEAGTVKCVALDLEGGGGTTATLVEGAIQAVERISGATSPSLGGDNVATFSLKLSQEGVIILEKAFRDATTPVGIIYDLEYRAMRPNLHVVARANMKQIYDHFSASLKAQYATVSGGIDAGLETLKANNVIKIDVKNYLDEEDKADKEKWALEFFKSELLDKFFTPTLNPDDMLKRMAEAEPLDAVLDRANGGKRITDNDPDTTDSDPDTTDDVTDTTDDDTDADAGKPTDDTTKPTDDTTKPTDDTTKPTDDTTKPTDDTTKPTDDTTKPTDDTTKPTDDTTKPTDDTTKPTDDTTKPTDDTTKPTDDTTKPTDGRGGTTGGRLPVKELDALKSAATGMPVVSFQLKMLKQVEDKELVFEYNRASATKRQYRPQESFGLMYEDIKKDPESGTVDPESKLPTKYFVSVDLDHPFFREFGVRVETIPDESFDDYGLRSAIASLEYGTSPRETKTKELSFQKGEAKSNVFTTYLNDKLELDYKQAVTFNFNPGGVWEGKTTTYRIPATGLVASREGTLNLDPTRFLEFYKIEVKTSEMVWDGIKSVDVHLECTDGSGWNPKKDFHLTKDSGDQAWKLRLLRRDEQKYSYQLIYNLADGTTRKIGPVETDNPTVLVDDLFRENRLRVTLKPVGIKWEKVDLILVKLSYSDPENGESKSMDFTFDQENPSQQQWQILVKNPEKKSYRWEAEYYLTDVDEPRKKEGTGSEATLVLRTPTS
jgi:hypothetical protein